MADCDCHLELNRACDLCARPVCGLTNCIRVTNKNAFGRFDEYCAFHAPKPVQESVHNPTHYNQGNIEVWDFIIDQHLDFCLGSAIKYIARAGKKDPTRMVEDLRKAIAFIEREIREHD